MEDRDDLVEQLGEPLDDEEEEEDDEDEENQTSDVIRPSGVTRDPSTAGQERMLRMIRGVLFRRMIRRSRHRRQQENESVLRPPIRVLSPSNAVQCQATCRFCLETSPDPLEVGNHESNEEEVGNIESGIVAKIQHLFIAPCSCTGSSEYVHVECLRKWQLRSTWPHASICSVCTSPYALRPPTLRKNLVPPGSLLVFQGEDSPGSSQSIFSKSVILMLKGSESESPMGVILNKPILTDLEEDASDYEDFEDSTTLLRGGPVCGGRFGVVRHVVAHTIGMQARFRPPQHSTTTEEGTNPSLFSNKEIIPGLCIVCEKDRNQPALMGRKQFVEVMSCLISEEQNRRSSETAGESAPVDNTDTDSQLSVTGNSASSIFAFKGRCKWSKDQLQNELLRGSWGIAQDVSPTDLWNVPDMWQTIVDAPSSESIPRCLVPRSDWFDYHQEDLLQCGQAVEDATK